MSQRWQPPDADSALAEIAATAIALRRTLPFTPERHFGVPLDVDIQHIAAILRHIRILAAKHQETK